MKGLIRVGIAAAFVLGLFSFGAAPSLAANVHCGDTITQDAVLDSDLIDCQGAGVVIGADDVTLDLNGHMVDGNGGGLGIDNTAGHDHAVIRDGAVTGFATGIQMNGADGAVIDSVQLSDNAIFGIALSGSDSTLVQHNSVERSYGGILVDGDVGGQLRDNSLSQNSSYGIELGGSRGDTVEHNVVSRNGFGIILARGAHANSVAKNSLVANGTRTAGFTGGILITDSFDNRLADNSLRSTVGFSAVILLESERNQLVGNRITDGANYSSGISVALNSSQNVLAGNSIEDTPGGIEITSGSSENAVNRNYVARGSEGVFLQATHDNEFTRNFTTGEKTGVLFGGGDARNRFRMNRVLRIEGTGILLDGRYDFGYGDTGTDGNEFIANDVSENLGDGLRSSLSRDGFEVYTHTLLRRNVFDRNQGDGLQLDGASNTVSFNRANENGELGIQADPGVTDVGGNKAEGNGNPLQCLNVFCK